MPLIEHSTYRAPFLFHNAHLHTVVPSFFRNAEELQYERERFDTPDGDYLYLDWSRCGKPSRELIIVSHGLCGHTHRHYILSLVQAMNQIGLDAVAWNYRGTGQTDNKLLKLTTNNSSDELDWVTRHAIAIGGYQRIYLIGYSMGGNLTMLYLAREASSLPPEVGGGVIFCGTIDLPASNAKLNTPIGKLYTRHFLRKLGRNLQKKKEQYPDQLDLTPLAELETFAQFDDLYTAPLMGFRNAEDYWQTASACRWLHQLKVPVLLVSPKDDPFLDGLCYPIEEARNSSCLFLEMPDTGGHCGFMPPKGEEWWPARRTREFLFDVLRPFETAGGPLPPTR